MGHYTIEKFKDGQWIPVGKSNSSEEWLKLMTAYQSQPDEDFVCYRIRLGDRIDGELKLRNNQG